MDMNNENVADFREALWGQLKKHTDEMASMAPKLREKVSLMRATLEANGVECPPLPPDGKGLNYYSDLCLYHDQLMDIGDGHCNGEHKDG
jgi:hypothetical protein